ncbi:alpha/beta hydrolase family protein [Pseudoalteromonas aurantia]|nr:alpha/beta fold hydrolase [Pseudoalteromonas aurantia]
MVIPVFKHIALILINPLDYRAYSTVYYKNKGKLMETYFTISCKDGQHIKAVRHTEKATKNGPLVVINSALGVKQEFYFPLAKYLANKGFSVITWDPRGIGLSSQHDVRHDKSRLRDWGQRDLTYLLDYIIERSWTSWQNLTLIGHSAGGHLVGLCPRIKHIKKVILICSGTCYWQLYPLIHQPKMLLAWCIVFPLVYKVLGYLPNKFGIGHDLPKGIVSDWRKWSLNEDYLFSDNTLGEHFYASYSGQLHAVGFSDDTGFSPKKTIADLAKRFPLANKSIKIYKPKELNKNKIGHFGFFKPGNELLWENIIVNKIDRAG